MTDRRIPSPSEIMIEQSFDLTAARVQILRDFRASGLMYLAMGLGVLAVVVFTDVYSILNPAAGLSTFALFVSLAFTFFAAVFLFAARGLLTVAPSELRVGSEGLVFGYPSGRNWTVRWTGRPRPFESELLVCEIWVRSVPPRDHPETPGPAVIGMCPPWPRRTRFYPSVGLTDAAFGAIIAAAKDRGLTVTKERLDWNRVRGFGTPCPDGATVYTISPVARMPTS
jgi:hypothetical protein